MPWPSWDSALLVTINEWHHPIMDALMVFLSEKWVWVPLYLYLLYAIYKVKGKDSPRFIGYILLVIALSDQTCSGLLKPWIARLRPCHEPSLQGLLHLAGGCGGNYGFCSSHTANAFALAMAMAHILKSKPWTLCLFFWAASISYSRIYLGAHYPLDVLAGAGIGMAWAWVLAQFKFFKKA